MYPDVDMVELYVLGMLKREVGGRRPAGSDCTGVAVGEMEVGQGGCVRHVLPRLWRPPEGKEQVGGENIHRQKGTSGTQQQRKLQMGRTLNTFTPIECSVELALTAVVVAGLIQPRWKICTAGLVNSLMPRKLEAATTAAPQV